MRFVGLPTTFSRSIGLSVAGVSNFMGSTLCLRQHRGERSLDQRQFVGIFVARLRAGKERRGGRLGAARQFGIGRRDAPRHVPDPAERNMPAAVAPDHRADRDQREGVRGAVADLVIDVGAAGRFRQRHRGDQLAGREHRFEMRRAAGRAIEIGERDAARLACRVDRFDRSVERLHRDRHVAGVGGDARLARADHGMQAAETADRGAAAAGLALVARLVGVVKIGTARALEQIARGRRLVAELARSPGDERAREEAIVAPDARVRGEVGVAHHRADPQSAVVRRLDPVEAEAAHVDQMRRRLDLELHQVEQVGAAGDEARARGAREGGGCRRGRLCTLIGEAFHAFTPATSVIASMMFE